MIYFLKEIVYLYLKKLKDELNRLKKTKNADEQIYLNLKSGSEI